MRRFWLAAFLALLAGIPQGRASEQSTADGPKLLVVLVVDQLRAGDLRTYAPRWRDGFRMLLEEGAEFTRAAYPYLNTATCAGHATIATGTLPRTHGIVLNRWWDRAARRTVACTEDGGALHVSYGAPASGGNSAMRILAPSLADELSRQRPGARVVSLAIKPRSAIGLAGHGPGVVTWFDEGSRSFVTSRAFSAAPDAGVSRFIARDPPTAALGQNWALKAPESSYRYPDIRVGERPKSGWSAIFPHSLAGGRGADAQYFERWLRSPFSDDYLARMAAALAADLRLGQEETIDYLAVSFSAMDVLGHDFGPDSREVEDLLIRLDTSIGTLLRRLDELVGRDRYVVALTSDHGTAPVPEQSGGGRIASEDVLQLLEQTLTAQWGARREESYIAWVGPGSVYFGQGVFERLTADREAFDAVVGALSSVPGVETVMRSDSLEARRDEYARAALAGYVPGRSGDLLFVARRHWIYELRSENDATNHGTSHDYDRRVPLLLRGYRIRPGRYSRLVSPADVAPTLAQLAGIEMPKAEGRPLAEAVR